MKLSKYLWKAETDKDEEKSVNFFGIRADRLSVCSMVTIIFLIAYDSSTLTMILSLYVKQNYKKMIFVIKSQKNIKLSMFIRVSFRIDLNQFHPILSLESPCL